MANIRAPKKREFSSISNGLLQDSSLSFAARGLLAYLLSKPPDWTCRAIDIQREGGIGKDARRKIMREAEIAGYLTFHIERNQKGQFHSFYDCHEKPVPVELRTRSWEEPEEREQPEAENPPPADLAPEADFPHPGDPHPGDPAADGPGDLKTKEVQIKDNTNKEDTSFPAGAGEGKTLPLSKHPMVVLYRDVSGFKQLNKIQIEQIATEVTDAEILRSVLKERGSRGCFLGNVANTLKDYHAVARGVPIEHLYGSPITEQRNGTTQRQIAGPGNGSGRRYETREQRNERHAAEYLAELNDVFGTEGPGYQGGGESDAWGAESLDQATDHEVPRRLPA